MQKANNKDQATYGPAINIITYELVVVSQSSHAVSNELEVNPYGVAKPANTIFMKPGSEFPYEKRIRKYS